MEESDEILVLLLDDDETWLRSLGRQLRRRGARCVSFTRAEPILETVAGRVPNVMVIDFDLGAESTGTDVARGLRSHLRTSCPPLLLVSGTLPEASEDDRAVFDAVFEKHMAIDALVEEILAHGAKARSASSQSALRAAVESEDALPQRKRRTPG